MILNIRGRKSYDNVNAMSGKLSCLQASVKERNPKAAWIPCAGHSLNLVEKCCRMLYHSCVFFDHLQKLHVFVTCSSHLFSGCKSILQNSPNLRIYLLINQSSYPKQMVLHSRCNKGCKYRV